MSDPNRILFRTRRFRVGEFRCPPGDTRWRRVNVISTPWPLVAFPGTSVVIQHDGREPILANPNHVIFYRGRERYRRTLHDVRGDHCVFVEAHPELVEDLLAAAGVRGGDGAILPFAHGPSEPSAYLRLRLLVHVLDRRRVDPLQVEETTIDALWRSVERTAALHGGRRRAARGRTEREHHRLVEDAKALLTQRAGAHDSLETLARALHTSEFHLCRVFRERTGFTLNRYRTHLRLRYALDRLAAGDANLATIAIELGFNSHSHFTDVFRGVFGVPPSDVRAALGRRDLPELRRMLEAPAAASS